MRFTTGTLADLTIDLNAVLIELAAPLTQADGTLASATTQLNALLAWRGSVLLSDGALASGVAAYNQFLYDIGVRTKFKRIKWAKPQVFGTDNQVIIDLSDNSTVTFSTDELETLDTEAKLLGEIQFRLSKRLYDIVLHKNRNGRWAIATGAAPAVWPEDEPVT